MNISLWSFLEENQLHNLFVFLWGDDVFQVQIQVFIDKYFSKYDIKHEYPNLKVNICHRHDACWHILPIKTITIT